jgi:phosphoribosylanthranilate isomerase
MKMLDLAKAGQVEIISKSHILCLYRNSSNEICSMELSSTDLDFLQLFETDSPTKVHHLDQNKLQFFQRQELLWI